MSKTHDVLSAAADGMAPTGETAILDTDSDPEAELVAAQQERIRLLEAALAARDAPPEAGLYDLDEVFVEPGTGTCLECSCIEFRVPKPGQGTPSTCWLCGHPRAIHKRNQDGAQARS